MAPREGFEPSVRDNRTPDFKSGAISQTLPSRHMVGRQRLELWTPALN